MNDPPPAEIMGRLRPIPTFRDHPATVARDIHGVNAGGEAISFGVVASKEPFLLLFLSTDCLGCRDLWEGMEPLRGSVPSGVRIVVLTRGPEQEDATLVARLVSPGTDVVMSSEAFADYRVGGPPFLVVVAGGTVQTEGVAWGIGETARATRTALTSPRG
ncbi:MAG TPA: hypothetical protein VNG12_18265 [Acidimicrobiales bacterium]|nr:hypothetical protein [Acidimicrobiales bacterium]